MDIDELIAKLRDLRSIYPGSRVFIGTSSQVINHAIPGMNAGYRVPVADDSRLGDASGEVDSLFIVTVSP